MIQPVLFENRVSPRQLVLIGSSLMCLLILSHCVAVDSKSGSNANNFNASESFEKQKGAHLFGRIDSAGLQLFHDYNLDWITTVPFGYQEHYHSAVVNHQRGDSLDYVRKNERWVTRIKQMRDAGFKVFLKPHIWIGDASSGKWRSDIYPKDEADWDKWADSYRGFILRYAKLAEVGGAEMFCVGAELTRISLERPDFWRKLIEDVAAVYSGKLTYAANWYEEYENIEFWDRLDYIGVQAYFPLARNNNASLEQISKGWDNHIPSLQEVANKFDKRILFTEIGYKSTIDSAVKPWEWMEYTEEFEKKYSLEAQTNCYQAFFDKVWDKEWFAGMHLWQMRSDHEIDPSRPDLDFTPQGKPAEEIIRAQFNLESISNTSH